MAAALVVAATGTDVLTRPVPTHSKPATGAGVAQAVTGPTVPVPKKMLRAKVWTPEVENIFRLQEAGYRDIHELRSLGQPEPEVWASSGLIKKLRTKLSLSGGLSLLYYREKAECGPKDLPKVKLYFY
mmetsp:Transcript_20027/g.40821  ORF Transcript_20027/g.40821 Transcript_20027/m.40821 type:complete len:128 (-) Transcript_20027:143-526(-)